DLPFEFDIDMSDSHYVAPIPIPAHVPMMLAPVLLQSHEDGTWDCRGTSFCVCPPTVHRQAIYVTARHVVDSLVDVRHADPYLLIPKSTKGPDANHLVHVPIDGISMAHEPNDLALL